MSKEMRFLIRLEKEDGSLVDFERWSYKKAETCINKMVALYGTNSGLYLRKLDKADKVVCYPTPDGCHAAEPVWSVSADEFRAMVEKWEGEYVYSCDC